MANPDSNLLLINQLRAEYDQLKADFDAFVANSVAVDSLSTAQKRAIVDGILEKGFQLKYTDPIVQAGDRVWGKDITNTLFGGDNFIATVVSVPAGAWSASNFTDVFRY